MHDDDPRNARPGRLSGKTALVTGGTSGIGLACARLFAREGARVIAVGRDEGRVRRTAADLGAPHLGLVCDVSDHAAVVAMAAETAERAGALDVVVASAGIVLNRPLADWTEADFDRVFAVNTKGQFFTAQKLAPLIRPGGVIILVGSVAASLGQPGMAVYGASKAAAPALARMLSADLLEQRVRVFCLTPGPVDTPIFENGGLTPAEARARLGEVALRVPVGRPGRPEELAAAALFLASDDSSFMLGAEVVVDGGKSRL